MSMEFNPTEISVRNNFDLKQHRESLWRDLKLIANHQPFDLPTFNTVFNQLYVIDRFWTFPGREVIYRLSHYLQQQQFSLITQLINNCDYYLQTGRYRLQTFVPYQTNLSLLNQPILHDEMQINSVSPLRPKPYFEVLIIHPFPDEYEMLYRQQLGNLKSPQDEFIYDIVFVDCAEDALTAILANSDIQACVYLHHIVYASSHSTELFAHYNKSLLAHLPPPIAAESIEVNLCRNIRCLRPDIDHYLISDLSPAEVPLTLRQHFSRVLFHVHPFQDLHAAILKGVRQRYSTPFFDALQAYSRQPKGVFHALPLSRGASVKGSPWIHDMLDFYGDNIFLAETSSTQGGLDSLLDPTGAIKQAHIKAAETFGADYSYFVTNGTSTSNKIVMQANLKPADIVLISADCHKSVPYSVVLTGAFPIFLETYPLPKYDLYGGIDLAQIKAVMLDLKKHGRLDRLKQITLTNSTFDGLVYHSENFMMEILAIKPDIIFHWDEAWSAFAHFHPLYYSRTAMTAVQKIRQRIQSHEYHLMYAQWSADFEANTDENKWQKTLYPDPTKIQLRVYATQSTHKTLTAFRQGSMIHVADSLFNQARFLEAFRIHTSTSPNYQIIASLDISRRQVAMEGFHLVRKAILLAMQLREQISDNALLQNYFTVLGDEELVPLAYRDQDPKTLNTLQQLKKINIPASTLAELSARWDVSGFVIDPTRITLDIRKTGLDGSGFRQLLMSRYDIQVNKTSRYTVLFLINIGATQATIDYLLQVLKEIATFFNDSQSDGIEHTQEEVYIPLPEKRRFHECFLPFSDGEYAVSDMRTAYFLGNDDEHIDYVALSAETLLSVQSGMVFVSANFVTPYPPGFPVILPGQIITSEILIFFQHIKIKEIHGFDFSRGFKVFRNDYLAQLTASSQSRHSHISPITN
ncbi:MAG: ornithine decarboxylase [Methylococcaceae bacterium]|nr:ornithine decarboxylase [Methylococcaceae bacterium]